MKKTSVTFLIMLIATLSGYAQTDTAKLTPEMAYAESQAVKAMTGKPAPPFAATSVNGEKFDITNMKGDVVLLCIWNTNCAPCIDEIKSFGYLVEKFKDKRIRLVALTPIDNLNNIKNFLKTHSFGFQVLYAPSPNFVRDYRADSYPTNYIIDQDGVIRYSQIGYSRNGHEDVDSVISSLL